MTLNNGKHQVQAHLSPGNWIAIISIALSTTMAIFGAVGTGAWYVGQRLERVDQTINANATQLIGHDKRLERIESDFYRPATGGD